MYLSDALMAGVRSVMPGLVRKEVRKLETGLLTYWGMANSVALLAQ
jgi:hypothetical protein